MKQSANALCPWVAVGAAVLFSMTATATTVIPPTFEEMIDRAELVFEGKVVSSRAEWRTVRTNRVIFTQVEFEKQEVLKGEAGVSITLQFLGGTVDGVTLEIDGVPKFSAGERVLLFVEGNGAQFCPLVGVFHGKFGVRKDEATGRDVLVRHNGKLLRDVAELGTGAGLAFRPERSKLSLPTDGAPMTAEDFKTKVREHLRTRAGQR